MAVNSTKLRFPFDTSLIIRDAGEDPVGVDTGTVGFPLDVMTGYWNDLGEQASLHLMFALVEIESINTADSNLYNLLVEVSPTLNFAAKREVFSLKAPGTGWYFLPILRDEVEYTLAETGSVAFATTANASDSHTISDGVNSRTFVAGTDYAVGASNTASATNFAAAINLDTNLRVVATVSSATVTLRNDRLTGGSIVENVDGGSDITVVNFSGGVGVAKYVRVFMDVTSTGVKQAGSVVFADEPTANDTVTIDDGVDTVVFTFGAGGGQVAVGADQTAAGNNLRIAINASILNVTAAGTGANVTITNDNYVGGSIAGSFATGSDATVTDFTTAGIAPASVAFWGFLSAR